MEQEKPCTPELEAEFQKKGFKIGEKINYGSYSTVYKGKFKEKDIAVKVIDLLKLSSDYKDHFLPRELDIIRKLRHPNIVLIYDIIETKSKIFIFMELASSDILDELTKHGQISEEKCKLWFKQTIDALAFIHKHGIAHRDLKIDNILLDAKNNVKLTDFGFSRTVFNPKTGKRVLSDTFCGSTPYSSPQIIKGELYNPMLADVYAMGVILYTMLNNQFPFEDSLDATTRYTRQMNSTWSHKEIVEAAISNDCKDIIRRMMEPECEKRITISKILEHPWLRGVKQTQTPIAENNSDSEDK